MGGVQFARRLAQYAIDASDWRLWTWWLWTRWLRIRAGSLWPAIWPIWRSAGQRSARQRRLWVQPRVGAATSGVGSTSVGRAAAALATGRWRSGTAIGARPAAGTGAGTRAVSSTP